jgi:transposase-like protein
MPDPKPLTWDDVLETVAAPSGRLAVDPRRAGKMVEGAWNAATAPVHAFEKLMETPYEPGTGDAGAAGLALQAGPGALAYGYGRGAGAAGAFGSEAPNVKALISAMRGRPEFESLADQIYQKLMTTRARTVSPSAQQANSLAPRNSPEGLSVAKLQRGTDAEQLGEIAERAAAWKLYKQMLGTDFELGAAGGAAKFKPQLSPTEQAEMQALLKKHPQHADEIRASYGLDPGEVSGASDVVSGWASEGTAAEGARDRSPRQVPDYREPRDPTQPGRRFVELPEKANAARPRTPAFTAESLGEVQQRIDAGESMRAIARDMGVSEGVIRKRLRQPYAEGGGPAVLTDPAVNELILTMARSGESSPRIAARLSSEVFGGQKEITARMVDRQIQTMRQRGGLDVGGLPGPGEEVGQMMRQGLGEADPMGDAPLSAAGPAVSRQVRRLMGQPEPEWESAADPSGVGKFADPLIGQQGGQQRSGRGVPYSLEPDPGLGAPWLQDAPGGQPWRKVPPQQGIADDPGAPRVEVGEDPGARLPYSRPVQMSQAAVERGGDEAFLAQMQAERLAREQRAADIEREVSGLSFGEGNMMTDRARAALPMEAFRYDQIPVED